MPDILDPKHEALVEHLFARTQAVLGFSGFELRPLRRRVRGRGKLRSFRLGYTKIGEKTITVDLYTPRTMRPRKIDAVLRVFAHELAHHQSPPRRSLFGWRHHYPAFWRQVKKNVALMQKDPALSKYF